MGAGKSYWGRLLSAELRLPLLDLDDELERSHRKSIAGLFEQYGEHGFRELEHQALKELSGQDSFVMSTGGGTPCFFDNMDIMNAAGLTIWLQAHEEVIWQRLRLQKQQRPLIRDLDDEALRRFIREKLSSRVPFYSQAQLILDPDACSTATWVQNIYACINPS